MSERRASSRWGLAWTRGTFTRSAIARLGLDNDVGMPTSDGLVGLLAQLRVATAQYAMGLRADGEPPEQMLVHVKALVCGAMMDDGWCDRDAMRSLMAAMVAWSIDAYYGP